MIDLDAARQQLADTITAAGVTCLPYTPDNPAPPIGFVDSLHLGFANPATFNAPPTCTAVVITCGQRYDRAAAVAILEAAIGPVVEALEALPGLEVDTVMSGTVDIGAATLPAVSYTLTFPAPTT